VVLWAIQHIGMDISGQGWCTTIVKVFMKMSIPFYKRSSEKWEVSLGLDLYMVYGEGVRWWRRSSERSSEKKSPLHSEGLIATIERVYPCVRVKPHYLRPTSERQYMVYGRSQWRFRRAYRSMVMRRIPREMAVFLKNVSCWLSGLGLRMSRIRGCMVKIY
jgi:hypothetical protein